VNANDWSYQPWMLIQLEVTILSILAEENEKGVT
jgi:hypothetical protein